MVDNSEKEERWRRIYRNDGEKTEENKYGNEFGKENENEGERKISRKKFRNGMRYRAKRC